MSFFKNLFIHFVYFQILIYSHQVEDMDSRTRSNARKLLSSQEQN